MSKKIVDVKFATSKEELKGKPFDKEEFKKKAKKIQDDFTDEDIQSLRPHLINR